MLINSRLQKVTYWLWLAGCRTIPKFQENNFAFSTDDANTEIVNGTEKKCTSRIGTVYSLTERAMVPMRRASGTAANVSADLSSGGVIKRVRIRADNVKKDVRQRADRVKLRANTVRKELEESEQVQEEVLAPRVSFERAVSPRGSLALTLECDTPRLIPPSSRQGSVVS